MAKVDLGGRELLQWLYKLQAKAKGPAIPRGVQRLGDAACGRLKAVTPVRTGNLRRGWQVFAGARVATIMNTVHYGPYVNWGHRQQVGRYVPAIGKRLVRAYVPGQRFLERGMEATRADVVPELQRIWGDMFGGF